MELVRPTPLPLGHKRLKSLLERFGQSDLSRSSRPLPHFFPVDIGPRPLRTELASSYRIIRFSHSKRQQSVAKPYNVLARLRGGDGLLGDGGQRKLRLADGSPVRAVVERVDPCGCRATRTTTDGRGAGAVSWGWFGQQMRRQMRVALQVVVPISRHGNAPPRNGRIQKASGL